MFLNTIQFFGAIEIGMLYGIVALGVYISFRVLDFPDLTVEGSFPLGASVAAILIINGYDPLFSTVAAMAAGAGAGALTAWLNLKWGILHLLAGILVMTALSSLNLRIMGRPNLPLLGEVTLFSSVGDGEVPYYIAGAGAMSVIALTVWAALALFFKTERGLAMRASGINRRMARAYGIPTSTYIYAGLALSNALVALAGALFAQSQGFADATLGVGTIVRGLAAIIIGEMFLSRYGLSVRLIMCLVGAVVYMLMRALALNADGMGLQPSDIEMLAALLVAGAMVIPNLRLGRGKRGVEVL